LNIVEPHRTRLHEFYQGASGKIVARYG